ncbi:UvrD-helicase domain-containing protein [Lentisphaerota bacterium ZTH]|nr:UvrD-helicase domain-containing protein [Lentisphaerota bacterium]WET06778.1 UvrD-helicase domain-containing protein [Lentisphaerota bacterium ZTH]
MTAAEILKQLNPEQAEAVKTIKGPVLVLAGAGTGKTRVITFRIAYMLQEGIDPGHILGLTFTNKAAREMEERLEQLVAPELARRVTLGTFHSFCVRILRKEIKHLGYLPNFTIADDSDQSGLLKQAAAALGYAKENVPLPALRSYIGRMKNKLLLPHEASSIAEGNNDAVMARIYREYQNTLEMQNMLDFDDMLLLVYELFDKYPEVLKKYQKKYQYLLVDEYQDTNDAQFEIIKMLAGKNCNLCVVGDDDQSIYGWRGANVGNILEFPRMFKNTTEVKLEQNYRSTNKILTAANEVIARNSNRFRKNLWSGMGEGGNLLLVNAICAEAESDFIAEFIAQEIEEHPEYSYSDFAVLYRSNHLSRQLEASLRNNSIPYKMVGGQEFFQRKEIKDAVAYLKLLVNPKEDQSLLRILSIPPRGLGKKAVELLKKYQGAAMLPFSELIGHRDFTSELSGKAAKAAGDLHSCMSRYRKSFKEPGELARKAASYLNDVGYLNGLQKIYKDIDDSLKRRENIDEFINAIAQFERGCETPPTLVEYLESYALLQENDKTEDDTDDGNGVTLTTVHAAKGLEYPYVFLVALEKNIFPHERSVHEGSIDEELRLFYVAMTRAKEKLIMSCSCSRMHRGFDRPQIPSEFITYIPEGLVDVCEPEDVIKKLDKASLAAGFAEIFKMLEED